MGRREKGGGGVEMGEKVGREGGEAKDGWGGGGDGVKGGKKGEGWWRGRDGGEGGERRGRS